ncbi:alpha/beta hydrolase [Streptococcus sp. NLN76]|uniref:alpha/beta hydrolase n=1 Tax=Streptococcus sp. NLN76 TaxID=2822800 RepID=UPI0018A8974F|nr:alpha/beta hydrolase [Streptococcus sp. NLN76]MBF8970018.1 alpha/beta hydrolase [Streptococcus sp. NLN76]
MRKAIYVFSLILLVLSCTWFFVRRNSRDSLNQVVQSQENEPVQLSETTNLVNEDYTVKRDDVELVGVITADANYKKEKRPLLVIAHGFNNTLENYETYAQDLASLGYVVYRFDFYGGSQQSKSGGQDMLDMSVLTEKADLEAVVHQLTQENFINDKKVTLLGASQGGVVSTLYAAENPDKVNKLALIFPAFVLFDDVEQTYAQLGVDSEKDIPVVVTHRNAQLGAIYLSDAMSIEINAEIKKVKAPVMIIHGTEDEVVPYSYALDANKNFSDSQLVTVEGGGHWIDPSFNQTALPALQAFLGK